MTHHEHDVESAGLSSAKQRIHIEGCTITTDGGVALLRRVAEKLSEISYRHRNDNLDAFEAFSFALDAVERAISDAITEYEDSDKHKHSVWDKKPII